MFSFAHQYWSQLKQLLINRYSIFFVILLSYTEIMQNFGGLPSFLHAWRLEIPLVLYLYYILNVFLRPFRFKPVVAATPIFLYYIGADIYFILFGRLPHIVELAELSELFRVFPLYLVMPLSLLLGLPFLAFLFSINFRRIRPITLGLLPLLLFILIVELFPQFFMDTFEKTQGEVVFYSDVFSTRNNGRLGMMLYNEARRKSYLEKIVGYRGNSIYRQEFNKAVDTVKSQVDKRNIHMIVLESFFDPTLMKGVKFSRRPVDPSFDELFHNKGGFSISPVFAGGTAQAEFEVLCGVPALRELSGVEFNVFTGSKTFCMPNILTQGGYDTTASNAFVPDFFNSTKAYAGMGFNKTYYPREYASARETYLSTGDVTGENYMFDGVLFSENIEFIAKKITDNPGKPIFNYINSIYGHLPHDINYEKRPKVIEVQSSIKDDQLERSANQYFYRTKALATFVKELISIDPNSLIILISDHLPPLSYGPNTYRDLDYLGCVKDAIHMNRIFIIENSRAVQYSTIHHFDIPRIVLNYVTKGKYCQEHTCDFKANDGAAIDTTAGYHDEYMSIMAQAMGGCEIQAPESSEEKTPANGAK
jgi:phosphoglycerol transferase MdoB-like AlkP superfamily enzyme